jgi:hypothetical protein
MARQLAIICGDKTAGFFADRIVVAGGALKCTDEE